MGITPSMLYYRADHLLGSTCTRDDQLYKPNYRVGSLIRRCEQYGSVEKVAMSEFDAMLARLRLLKTTQIAGGLSNVGCV